MLELIPDIPACCTDQTRTMDLLVRVTPPRPARPSERAPVNLALVLDRSGSMAGRKMELTRQAAGLAVRSLTPQDRVSVVLFDDRVDTLVRDASGGDPNRILHMLSRVDARGSTALFDGWRVGGDAAACALQPGRINRVVLLTDGCANVGETNPDRICQEVHRLARNGLQTTTVGFGNGYNEDLLRAMASSGEGNHYYVERPEQLVSFFELELGGMTATLGTRVRLSVDASSGVELEPLVEYEREADGSFRLGDLVVDCPMMMVFRLRIPAVDTTDPAEHLVARVKLRWLSRETGQEQGVELPLALPARPWAELEAASAHCLVVEQVTLAMAARARSEAVRALDQGEETRAEGLIHEAMRLVSSLPRSVDQDLERQELRDLLEGLQRREYGSSRKKMYMSAYSSSRSSKPERMGLPLKLLHAAGLEEFEGALLDAGLLQGWRPTRERVFGMLRGLVVGERLGLAAVRKRTGAPASDDPGESACVTRATLEAVAHARSVGLRLNPSTLADALARVSVPHPGPALIAMRERYLQGLRWSESGGDFADAAALRRVAPVLVLSAVTGRVSDLQAEVALSTRLTHHGALQLEASLALATLLWQMMGSPRPLDSEDYLQVFLGTLQDLESVMAPPCPVKAGRFDGFIGPLSALLAQGFREARKHRYSVAQACAWWGSGDHLPEAVATLLYTLELHADEPDRALLRGLETSEDPVGMGCLLGTALGALHGPAVIPQVNCGPEWEAIHKLAAGLGLTGEQAA